MLEFSVDKKLDEHGDPIEIVLTTLDDDCFNIGHDIIRMFDDCGFFIDNYLDCFAQAFCARQLVESNYKRRLMKFEAFSKLIAKEIVNCLLSNKYPEELFDEATYDDYLLRFISNTSGNDSKKLRWYRLCTPVDE